MRRLTRGARAVLWTTIVFYGALVLFVVAELAR